MMTDADALPHEEDDEELSLEELAAVYARVLGAASAEEEAEGKAGGEAAGRPEPPQEPADEPTGGGEPAGEEDGPVDPAMVVEAALFVGNPEGRPLSARQLAAIMRGVSPEEVEEIVDGLNAEYRTSGGALEIRREAGGFRLGLSPEAAPVRDTFYGRVREARLSQAAVEVLALVAYQPGVTLPELDAQRGKGSAAALGQLVRRRLLEIRRAAEPGGGRPVARYWPTERFLNLFGLDALEDLPHVEEADLSSS